MAFALERALSGERAADVLVSSAMTQEGPHPCLPSILSLTCQLLRRKSSQVTLIVPKPLDVGSPQKAYLLEDAPPVLDALGREKSLRLINIWISMQTKEQFISKSTEIVQDEVIGCHDLMAADEHVT